MTDGLIKKFAYIFLISIAVVFTVEILFHTVITTDLFIKNDSGAEINWEYVVSEDINQKKFQ